MAKTWLPFTIKSPGPSWKQGYPGATSRTLAQIEGEVKHSAEGSLQGLFGELDRADRTASWHFSLAKDGRVFQHYPLEAICWHTGLAGDRRVDTSLIGNATLIGEEHEGGGPGNYGEPLTEAQYAGSSRISQAVRDLCPRVGASPPTPRLNLWEHNWLSWTSCPSGRIPWTRLITDLEEDDMKLLFYRYKDGSIYNIRPDGKRRPISLGEALAHKEAGATWIELKNHDPKKIAKA